MAAISFVTWLAWHDEPYHVPHKQEIDSMGLKLERSIDLARIPTAKR
jgi:hypothetical protein